jgi:hypothetical protein
LIAKNYLRELSTVSTNDQTANLIEAYKKEMEMDKTNFFGKKLGVS